MVDYWTAGGDGNAHSAHRLAQANIEAIASRTDRNVSGKVRSSKCYAFWRSQTRLLGADP
jgi:hypothetical protein